MPTSSEDTPDARETGRPNLATLVAVAAFVLAGMLIANWLIEVLVFAGMMQNLTEFCAALDFQDCDELAEMSWSTAFEIASPWPLTGVVPAALAGVLLIKGKTGGRVLGQVVFSAVAIVYICEWAKAPVVGSRFANYDGNTGSDFAVPDWYVPSFIVVAALEIGLSLSCLLIMSLRTLILPERQLDDWLK